MELEFVLFHMAMAFSAVFSALTKMVSSDTQVSGGFQKVHELIRYMPRGLCG